MKESGIALRPATSDDFEFAWRLYRDPMQPLTEELLEWREERQRLVIAEAVKSGEAQIITADGGDVGWLQVRDLPDQIWLLQLYVALDYQGRGIGTRVMGDLMARARSQRKAIVLDVMKNNPARIFYERLGFRVVAESEYKFSMAWRDKACKQNR